MELDQTVVDQIKQQIESNDILIYMKGSPQAPQCGFSAHSAQALMKCGVEFSYIDILENPEIRATLPKVANWPTFPQLYIKGELIGGCDIIMEMFESGELQDLLAEFKAE
jgi:monothiol glutaredoxin